MNKRFKLVLAASLIVLLLISGMFLLRQDDFSPSAPNNEAAVSSEIRLAVPAASALLIPLYVTQNQGFFARKGLSVKLLTSASQDEALSWLFSAECDLLLGGPEAALQLNQQKNEKRLEHIAQASAATGYFLISHQAENAFSWQSLKGKIIIGTNPGELPAILFNQICKENGLRPLQDVHIIHNLPTASVQSVFQAQTGHYVIASEPLASRLEKEDNCFVVAALDLPTRSFPASTFMVTSEFRQKHADDCQRFAEAFQEGLNWVREYTPEEIVSCVQEYFPGEDPKVLLRAVSRYKSLGCWPESALIDTAALERLQDMLIQENELLAK